VLRQTLSLRFRWWAGLLRVHRSASGADPRRHEPLAPAFSLAAAGPFSRFCSPPLVRAGALLPTRTLRVDLHPADLDHPRHVMALEWVLKRSAVRREAVTYEELACG
jgi:hypothetical protein